MVDDILQHREQILVWNAPESTLAVFCLNAVIKHFDIPRKESENIVIRGYADKYYNYPRKVLTYALAVAGYTSSDIGRLLGLSEGHILVQRSRMRQSSMDVIKLGDQLATIAIQQYKTKHNLL